MLLLTESVLSDLAPTGRLRAAINFGNPVLAQRSATSGEPTGITVAIAYELARRLNVELMMVPYEAAGAVVDAARSGAWDVAFLAIDPKRKDDILFTEPYVLIEATYLVRSDSPIQHLDEVDRPGIRISVGRGAAYDLYLSRTLKHAEIVRCDTSQAALDTFRESGLEAAAGVVQPLQAYVKQYPHFRTLNERFATIRQAMGTPAGRHAGDQFLQSFIQELKATGFIAATFARLGQTDMTVAG